MPVLHSIWCNETHVIRLWAEADNVPAPPPGGTAVVRSPDRRDQRRAASA